MSEPVGTRDDIVALAERLGVRYETTPEDALAEIITRLADDEVVTDDIENSIVVLRRAGTINGGEMVDLLGRKLTLSPPSHPAICEATVASAGF